MLTSRERVLCALNHEEPDRVPIFFGVNAATTMISTAYESLKAYLGIECTPRLLSRADQYALIDEEAMIRLGCDARPLVPNPVPSALRREVSDNIYIDEWGITWSRSPGAVYYTVTDAPLRNANIDDLDTYPWPDLAHASRFEGLAEEARQMREHTPYATVALGYLSTFEFCQHLRGLDTWLMDFAINPDFAQALLRKITDLMIAGVTKYLDAVGEYIDLITMADDLGTQTSLLISPKIYRKLVKPCQAELISAVKQRTKAKVFLHSDGNIYPLLGDLIEIGVNVLNPIQVSAGDMGDTARLKREFGDKLSFCGAVDTQKVLPYGTPDDVRQEVRRRIKDLGPGGGYICASVHCIQPDVPPENVVALFEEAAVSGRYPLEP